MGSVWAMVAVEGDPASDASLGLRSGFSGVQVDAFIVQLPPQALDEDVGEAAIFSVHRDSGSHPLQPVGPDGGRELRPLIGVYDLRRAEAVDCLVQRLDAEVRLPDDRQVIACYHLEGACL